MLYRIYAVAHTRHSVSPQRVPAGHERVVDDYGPLPIRLRYAVAHCAGQVKDQP